METMKEKSIVAEEELGIFDDMDEAIEAAAEAQKVFSKLDYSRRKEIVDAFRNDLKEHVEEISKMALEETGMGRLEDKIAKNLLVLNKTPGVEDIETRVTAGDDGTTLYEMAPFGVIGAITPSTNPTATILNNGISMLSAGNTVVFSPHPGAKKTSVYTVELINKAIKKVNGPNNLIVTVKEPSIEKTNILLSHDKVKMICATGGPQIVKIALSSGKKAIGAGAGNPPVVVDETADIEKAAADIISGCAFDNNMPCIAEKEVIVVDEVADKLKEYMSKNNALEIKDKAVVKKLQKLVLTPEGNINKKCVGKNADYLMSEIGEKIDPSIKVVFTEVLADHPFAVKELMMPILPVIRVNNVDEAIELAKKLEHGNRHTSIIHSKNVDTLKKFEQEIETTICVKNGPSYAGVGFGGEGFTTFTIAGPTGEGLTSASTFTRKRKIVLVQKIK